MMHRAQAPLGGLLGRMMPRARIVPAVKPKDMSQDPKVKQRKGGIPGKLALPLLGCSRFAAPCPCSLISKGLLFAD